MQIGQKEFALVVINSYVGHKTRIDPFVSRVIIEPESTDHLQCTLDKIALSDTIFFSFLSATFVHKTSRITFTLQKCKGEGVLHFVRTVVVS